MPKRILALPVLAATALALVAGASARTNSGSIALVAYSTPREAYAELIPAFQKTAAGKARRSRESYGASGEQARAVEAGLKADVVALSLEPDVTSLVEQGTRRARLEEQQVGRHRHALRRRLRRAPWQPEEDPRPGRTSSSRASQVVTPNVQTSGGAKWNIMAAYGAQLRKKGKTHEAGRRSTSATSTGTSSSQDKSAREALQTFLAGRGDVLLAYENEAIFAKQNGQEVHVRHPEGDDPDREPGRGHVEVEEQGDRERVPQLPAHGAGTADLRARTATGRSSRRRRRASSSRSDRSSSRSSSLGGWAKVEKKFFDPNTGIVTRIQRETGS